MTDSAITAYAGISTRPRWSTSVSVTCCCSEMPASLTPVKPTQKASWVPAFMFAFGYRHRSLNIIKIAAVLALLGIVLNRINVSIIAFRWYEAVRYYPSWQEIVVTLMVICAEIWIFRWVVNRMPVFSSSH